MSLARGICFLPLMAALCGCQMVVMDPGGDVAVQQRNLILIATVLMLLIAIPVMILTAVFAWRYRQSNTAAAYDPEWSHSSRLEMVIWAAPLAIIVVLGAVSWMSTHLLDPYRPLTRLAPSKPVPTSARTLRVEVVALDWKWLFIYPDLGVATVNELVAPVDTPIEFRITASSVMNSFFVPALAGQIYAMPGMETRLHAVINRPGIYEGFSANYSGEGYSDMRFRFQGTSLADFNSWVSAARAGGGVLGRQDYLQLERPSARVPARRYATVASDLYPAILGHCVEPGKMCMGDMMHADADGGQGMASVHNVARLEYDKRVRRGGDAGPAKTVVAAIHAPGAERGPVTLRK